MPQRVPKPAPIRRSDRGPSGRRSGAVRRWLAGGLAALALGMAVWALRAEGPGRLRARAEAAQRAGDWPTALRLWRAVNRTRLARGRTHLAEARACLALDRAAQAERALRRAVAADPEDPEPWRLLLQLYRVEQRDWEARRVGTEAIAAVLASARRAVLRDATLALLADLPDAQARAALDRWSAADPDDLDARVARLRRGAEHPADGDPDRAARIARLTALLARDPAHVAARGLLAESLADAGAPRRGRQVLDAWPPAARDARYDRLLGRWLLDFEHDPAAAATCFQRALTALPDDWRTHYRLARAWHALGREDAARREAETVGRLRDALDPARLGPRLDADVARLDTADACRDLADLCARLGLAALGDAWHREAARTAPGRAAPYR